MIILLNTFPEKCWISRGHLLIISVSSKERVKGTKPDKPLPIRIQTPELNLLILKQKRAYFKNFNSTFIKVGQ